MSDVRRLAAEEGVALTIEDTGDWGSALLVAEYDPAGPAIRINARALERIAATLPDWSSCDAARAIDHAVAHELYHHRERTGAVARAATRTEREAEAERFATALAPLGERLARALRAAAS